MSTPASLDDLEVITYQYNRQSDITGMTDPNGTSHSYVFDQLGRQTEDSVTTFAELIDQSVTRIETSYDAKRLLTDKVTSYDGATVVNEVQYQYDHFGQLSRDSQEHDGEVDEASPSVSYGYEGGARANSNRRTSLTYPDGRKINVLYGTQTHPDDRLSRVSGLAFDGASEDLCAYTYVGSARYVKIAYPAGDLALSYIRSNPNEVGDAGDPYTGYDRFGRTVDMPWTTTDPSATLLDRVQYGYDRSGNRTWRRNLAADNGGQDNAYGYDGLYQVKEAALGTLNLNQTSIGGTPTQEERFEYDPTGNWTRYRESEEGTETLDQTRVNNQVNQITQIDGSSDGIAYDAAGNATQLPPGNVGATDEDWNTHRQFVWDGWNRLVAVQDENGTTLAEYQYDGTYRRIRKSLPDGDTIDYYYNDQWKCVEERASGASSIPLASSSSSSSSLAPSGPTTTQYVWGARPGHRDELVLRDRDTDDSGSYNERHWCLMDYFNAISLVSDEASVIERYRYSAFGMRTVMESNWTPRPEGSAYEFAFAFQGQFRDQETAFYDYGFRYYSPDLGRWLSKDPIGEKGGMNLYLFVENNGVTAIDHLGLVPRLKCIEQEFDNTAHCGYALWVIKWAFSENTTEQGFVVQNVTIDARVYDCATGERKLEGKLADYEDYKFTEVWPVGPGTAILATPDRFTTLSGGCTKGWMRTIGEAGYITKRDGQGNVQFDISNYGYRRVPEAGPRLLAAYGHYGHTGPTIRRQFEVSWDCCGVSPTDTHARKTGCR